MHFRALRYQDFSIKMIKVKGHPQSVIKIHSTLIADGFWPMTYNFTFQIRIYLVSQLYSKPLISLGIFKFSF